MDIKTTFFKRLEAITDSLTPSQIIVAYSGGKDSSVLLHLTAEFCLEKRIPLVVLHGDTLVENPVVRAHCDRVLNRIKVWSEEIGFPVKILIAKPKPEMTFWVCLIGKGYPMPNFKFRWCQNHLKIKPAREILKSLNGILLVATRLNESIERRNSLQRRLNVNYEVKSNFIKTFAPLCDFTDIDIWEFLISNSPPWDRSYMELIRLYKNARGECPLIPEKNFKTSGCGSRFGCWVCSVVRDDRSMKNLAEKDNMLGRLYFFRNWLVELCSQKENRTGFTRKGNYIGEGKGTLTFRTRFIILKRLLKLQKETGYKLIKDWELDMIYKLWEEVDVKIFTEIRQHS